MAETDDFLAKYYPGVKRRLHLQRIRKLEEQLEREKDEYIKLYPDTYI